MHFVLSFFAFMNLHLASHLDMLDEPREACNVGAKPEDVVWWTYPEDGRTKQVLGRGILAKRVLSNKHWPSVGSQARPGAF
jgi:hypothetical protein